MGRAGWRAWQAGAPIPVILLSSSARPLAARGPRVLICQMGMIMVKVHWLTFMEYLLFQML